MMTNRCLLFFAGTIFLCCAAAAAGADPTPGSSVTVTIDEEKAAKEAAENKKAVINQLIKLLLNRRPPVLLSTQASKEAKPEISIVNGKDDMATMVYRCRYIDPEYLTDALDAVALESAHGVDIAANPAKMVALELADSQPVVWGGSVLAARASRRVAEAVRTASGRVALAADAIEFAKEPRPEGEAPEGVPADLPADVLTA